MTLTRDSLNHSERRGQRRYCIACGQNLAGIASVRCPECGTRFDPSNPSTYATEPSVWRRLITRYPAWKRHSLRRFTVLRCRTCGHALPEGLPGKCAGCGHLYDPREPEFVARTLITTPPILIRLGHGSVFLGIVVPGIVAAGGIWMIVVKGALPSRPPGSSGRLSVAGISAVMVGVTLLGVALSMHSSCFWGRIEPFWRFAPLGTRLGYLVTLLGTVCFAIAVARQFIR